MKDEIKVVNSKVDGEEAPVCMQRRNVLIASAVASTTAVIQPQIVSAQSGGSTAVSVSATYPKLKVISLADLVEGESVAFNYPLNEQPNVLVKMGRPAQGGIGPDFDIVAFSVLCPHMGGSLRGRYQHDHGAIGPCPFHYSTFDLAKGGVPVHASATQNLPQITLETDGEDIYAVGISGLVYGFRDNLADGTLPEGAEIIGKEMRSIPTMKG